MSRRKKAIKRPILPDARYDSQTVAKFINVMMYQGKKSTAERIFNSAMEWERAAIYYSIPSLRRVRTGNFTDADWKRG